MATETTRAGSFLASEAQGTRSREQVTLLKFNDNATVYQAGQILSRYNTTGVATYAAGAGNTGNGACGAIVTSAGVKPGVYTGECIKAAANAGTFRLEDPDGIFVGNVVVGAAFAGGGLAFTLADGATDFVVGDTFTISLPTSGGNVGKYISTDLTGKYGREVAAGILFAYADVSGNADVQATVIVRDAEVKADLLVYPTNNANDIAAINAQLAELGIIVRDCV